MTVYPNLSSAAYLSTNLSSLAFLAGGLSSYLSLVDDEVAVTLLLDPAPGVSASGVGLRAAICSLRVVHTFCRDAVSVDDVALTSLVALLLTSALVLLPAFVNEVMRCSDDVVLTSVLLLLFASADVVFGCDLNEEGLEGLLVTS